MSPLIRYKVFVVPTAESPTELEERLFSVGAVGWDLITAVQTARGPIMIFKRSKAVEDGIIAAYEAEQKSSTSAE